MVSCSIFGGELVSDDSSPVYDQRQFDLVAAKCNNLPRWSSHANGKVETKSLRIEAI